MKLTADHHRALDLLVDLGSMRAEDVRSLLVTCQNCHRERVLDVDVYPDSMTLDTFAQSERCAACGAGDADVRPNRYEHRARGGLLPEQGGPARGT